MAEVGADYKGKAKAPSFYKPAPEPRSEPKQERHWPLLIGGALAGAGILLYLRSRQSGSVGTAPVLSVAANPSADISQLQNMNNTVQEMLANPQLWQRTTTGQTVSSSPTPDSQQSVPPPNDTSTPGNSTVYAGGGYVPTNSPQANALANPNEPYMIASQGGNLVTFTPNQARAWWDAFFAHPFDIRLAAPGSTPGTLVLTPDQYAQAIALGEQYRGVKPPSSLAGFPIQPNPNIS